MFKKGLQLRILPPFLQLRVMPAILSGHIFFLSKKRWGGNTILFKDQDAGYGENLDE